MMIPSLLLLPALLQSPPAAERPFALMVGDPAPAIEVAEWVQGTPVTRFEPGQTYVLEFWATWCPPCKVAIPHLNELSKKHADSVRFVGVSVWEKLDGKPYLVPQFVKEMGEQMTYTVASDLVTASEEEGPMAKRWMNAAGQTGIPSAFIVNGAGRIAWIGHPMGIDKPLAEVVAGTWDIDAAAKKYALDQRLKGTLAKLNKEVSKAKKEKDYAGALRVIEQAIASEPLLEANFGLERYFLLLDTQRPADAAAYGQRLVAEVLADNAYTLNLLAWTIIDPQGKRAQGDYALAVQAAERAVKLQDGKDASTLDTLGLALFKSGQVARALEVQEKAAALAKGQGKLEVEILQRLEEFKKAAKNL